MSTILYFAYGSNMSTLRLCDRVPSAKFFAGASLNSHLLKFHKESRRDNSGKCDIEFTDNPEDIVYGVLFTIDANEKQNLDRHEGLNNGYGEKEVFIIDMHGVEHTAVTYYASSQFIAPHLKPYDWYKEHVLRGAQEHNLPKEYIQAIESVESMFDPDANRRNGELAIYDRTTNSK